MSLKKIMETASVLAEEVTRRDAELHRKHGLELGIKLGDPAAVAYMRDAKDIAVPLVDYLESLDQVEAKKLVTLMYAGRDGEHLKDAGSLKQFHDDLKRVGVHDKTKAEYIHVLKEKRASLPHYFRAVSSLCVAMNVDPDVELESVA